MTLLLSATWFFYWLLLPATLFTSVILRFNGLSAFYCLFLITMPYSPRIGGIYMRSWRRYCFVVLFFSGMFVAAHAGFQIALAVNKPYGSLLGEPCSFAESTARYVGFQRLDNMDALNICRLLLPDVVTFIISILTMILINKSDVYYQQHEQQQTTAKSLAQLRKELSNEKTLNGFILVTTFIFLVVAGTAYPSVVSSIYLISFIILAMMWAFHVKLLTPAVALLRAFLCAIASFQLLMLYLYQIQHIQDLIPKESIYTRLFGLTPIIRINCTTPHQLLLYPGLKWSVFVEPSGVFLLLWSMAVGVRMFFRDYSVLVRMLGENSVAGPSGSAPRKNRNSEYRPLVEGEEIPANYNSISPTNDSNDCDVTDDTAADDKPEKLGLLSKIEGKISELKYFSFYVVALIIMMVWSVTYHSWLTFVLLIWACGLWMVKERSWYTLCCSPVFTIYGILIVLLQFIYSLDLNESELPTVINQTDGNKLYLSAFGIRRYDYPFLHLGIQILYLCGFWLVLHQFNYIRKHGGSGSTNEADTDSWAYRLGEYCKEMLSRYWIFVVIGFHIAIATEGYPSGTKIIYFALFVLSTVSFVISWQFFRKTLQLYWIVLVIYTMIVLGLIYTYQFQDFPKYWKQLTHFTDQQLQDLGLIQYNNPFELMLSILLPALFLLVVVLQLQYFNDRFLEVTGRPDQASGSDGDGHTGEEGSAEEYEMGELNSEDDESWLTRQCRKMCPVVIGSIKTAVSLFIRGMEFHLWRLVFITAFAVAAYKVSAIYGVVVVFWVLMLPARVTHRSLYIATTVGLSLVGMAIMFLQLHFINLQLPYNCTVTVHGIDTEIQQNMSRWIGIEKMNRNGIFFNHINGLIAILLMISFERVITLRQQWRSKWLKEVRPTVTAFYPSVTWRDADKGLVEFCKYFANFAFYKFGVETCFVMSVVTIWVRADMYAIVYSLLLVIALVLKTRLSLHRYWKFYSVALVILLVWQYLICLGMPPVWCAANQYPWMDLGSNMTEHNRLVRWMFLPDYLIVQDSTALIADFFQLLFVIAQLFVFEHENGEWTQFGGDNRYLTGADLDQVTLVGNPRKNFMLKKARSVLDQLKGFTFKYMIWVTMAMVFVAGTTRISLFCLGYLISFFYLLSRHQELMMGAPSRLLLVWNVVLGYNVSVITLKVALQVVSCVYIETLQQRACSVVQLLSLVCSKRASYGLDAPSTTDQTCELSYTNAGLTWDFICFLFLLTQRRIFSSYYLLHASEDLKISMQLAARGAELFNEKLMEVVRKREGVVAGNLRALKQSMNGIKERYATLRRGLPLLTTHTDATQSGDYYMFDDVGRADLSKEPKDDIMDPIKMLHTLGTKGMEETMEERMDDKRKMMSDDEVDGEPSHDHRESDCDEPDDNNEDCDVTVDEEKKEKSISESICQCLRFTGELILSCVDYLTIKLNTMNLDYRNVSLQLESEKDAMSRERFREQKSPRASTEVTIDVNNDTHDVIEETDGMERSALDDDTWQDLNAIDFDKDQHWILRFFYSLWFIIISRTDVVCYFLFILNLMLSSSILSLVLPLSVFLWATFTTPRPTKIFWLFARNYLQIVIVVKFVFQFEFWSWNSELVTNSHLNEPFWWPRFIGIEQSSSWMVMELLQLLAVVFHVSIIKVQGLWDSCEQHADCDVTHEASTSQEQGGEIEETNKEEGGKKVGGAEIKHTSLDKFLNIIQLPYNLYSKVLNQRFSSVTDVYVYMFLCDVINFIIIVFGYWAFGSHSSQQANVVSDLQSNQVPTGFLIMLLIQFSMIIIDRGIYLRKSLLAKMIFQLILIVGIHVWMFFVLPAINKRPFFQNSVAQTWYFFKACYFLLSAHQIRCGYPQRVVSNFLTKSHGTVNLFLFKGYRLIPFLAEATTVMNWTFTSTSMTISEWLKLWSVHGEVFELKCWRVFDDEYPSKRGEARAKWVQYLIGGGLVFLIFAIIWFPLLLMNIALTIGGVTNNPTQVDVKITLGSFEPLFQVVADADDMTTWTTPQFKDFQQQVSQSPAAAAFLSGFTSDQVTTVTVDGESKTVWIISPPQYDLLVQKLNPNSTKSVRVLFEWTLTNDPAVSNIVTASGSNSIMLNNTNEARRDLYQLLQRSNATNITNGVIKELMPQFIHSSGSSSSAFVAYNLYDGTGKKYADVELKLREENTDIWWRVLDNSTSGNELNFKLHIFSDKVSPASLSFLVNYGLIGLYVSVVLVVGRLVRSGLVGATSTIMFLELPDVDRILQLCNDIFLVQEEKEFELEEDLYAKLIFLYRSPATLIKWTKLKQH